MVSLIEDGFTFKYDNDKITFRLHGIEDECCEIMTREFFRGDNLTSDKIKSWTQIEKHQLPDYIRNLENLNDDIYDDKKCELVAINIMDIIVIKLQSNLKILV